MATIKSTWIASHVGWGKLIGRISVGISHFSFTILDFCFLWVSCGGPRSHFQINLIKTLHLHFTSLWLYGFLLSLGIWHRKQIILRQVNSWSLNSFFSQVDTQLYSPFTEANLMFFSYFSLNFNLGKALFRIRTKESDLAGAQNQIPWCKSVSFKIMVVSYGEFGMNPLGLMKCHLQMETGLKYYLNDEIENG